MGFDDLFKDFGWPQLAIFVAFALPGFISLQVWSMISPASDRTFLDKLPEAIAFGVLNAVVVAPLVVWIAPTNLVVWYILLVVGLVALPAMWPFVVRQALETLFRFHIILNPAHNGWDAAFRRREPYFVIVHLKDGRRIGGYYGYQSYAGVYPASGHLYLESVWTLDAAGHFISVVPDSRGIVLRPEDYQFIELLEG